MLKLPAHDIHPFTLPFGASRGWISYDGCSPASLRVSSCVSKCVRPSRRRRRISARDNDPCTHLSRSAQPADGLRDRNPKQAGLSLPVAMRSGPPPPLPNPAATDHARLWSFGTIRRRIGSYAASCNRIRNREDGMRHRVAGLFPQVSCGSSSRHAQKLCYHARRTQ